MCVGQAAKALASQRVTEQELLIELAFADSKKHSVKSTVSGTIGGTFNLQFKMS